MTSYSDEDFLHLVNPEIKFTEEGERQARELADAALRRGALGCKVCKHPRYNDCHRLTTSKDGGCPEGVHQFVEEWQ